MGFEYDPKDASNVLKADTYDASIKTVVDTNEDGSPLTSKKSGEKMQKVTFEVYPATGKPRLLDAYYTAKSSLWQYKKLATALGKDADFKAKKFNAAELIGVNLRLELVIKEDKQYGDKNEIAAYHPGNGKSSLDMAAAGASNGSKGGDEDIPF